MGILKTLLLIIATLILFAGHVHARGIVCEKIFQEAKVNTEAVFYVDSKGQAFPSVGYRYYSYKQLESLGLLFEKKELVISDKNWVYITFEKYNSAHEAKNFLQVPHDASIRVTFSLSVDTAVIKIPKGKYGKGPWLEPFAKDHPEYGQGGGSQYIISHSRLTILEVYDMKNKRSLL